MGLRRLIRNIKLLSKVELSEFGKHLLAQEGFLDSLSCELHYLFQELQLPEVKDCEDTITELIEQQSSIVRFGDGELRLISGHGIPFQNYSDALRERLIEVLTSQIPSLMVAIPYVCYSSKKNVTQNNKVFWLKYSQSFRTLIEDYLCKGKQYYAAEVTLAHTFYEDYDLASYFARMRQLWDNRPLTIICGESVFQQMEHNLFDNAESVEYQHAPALHAFEHYDSILESALQLDKNRLIIAILGPCAKVLCYDLHRAGYQALDLGHLAKSYDWWKRNKSTRKQSDAIDFFNPD